MIKKADIQLNVQAHLIDIDASEFEETMIDIKTKLTSFRRYKQMFIVFFWSFYLVSIGSSDRYVDELREINKRQKKREEFSVDFHSTTACVI